MVRRDTRRRRRTVSATIAGCLCAAVALSLDETTVQQIRLVFRDGTTPALRAAGSVGSAVAVWDWNRWPWSVAVPEQNPAGHSDGVAEQSIRRLELENAAWRERQSRSPDTGVAISEQGADSRLVTADVIAEESPGALAGGMILNAGLSDGVEAGRPVVLGTRLNRGSEGGLVAGAEIVAGGTVLGRISEVGRWTSTVLPVTSLQFRAHVRTARAGAGGTSFVAQAILEGDGTPTCLLRYLAPSSRVEVGDAVYTHDPTGLMPAPLYFGKIESATLQPGATEWDVRVRPDRELSAAQAVTVVQPSAKLLSPVADARSAETGTATRSPSTFNGNGSRS